MLVNKLVTHLSLDHTLDATVGTDAVWVGDKPEFVTIENRTGLRFDGSGYVKLSENLLDNINDETGFTFSTWVFVQPGQSVWERIFDFGATEGLPSVFLTRNFRATLSGFGDLVADGSKGYKENSWIHLTYVYTPTDRARNSSAGGRVYVDGQLIGEGLINQTTSGLFGQLKNWTRTLEMDDHYTHNYLGHSQYAADPNFKGILSDVRLFNQNLNENEILGLMAETLKDQDIIDIAKSRDLDLGLHIISKDIELPTSLFGDMVDVMYVSSHPDILSVDGKVNHPQVPTHVTLDVIVSRNDVKDSETFHFTVMPKDIAPYEIKIKDEKIADVSEILYGLFYEDINNAADGGIYGELIRNRSFESFEFRDFTPNDNVCGCELGRNHDPYQGWYGDLDKTEIKLTDTLDDFLNLDKGTNSHYISVKDGTLINKGYNDSTHKAAMLFKANDTYDLSLWVKGDAHVVVRLLDENNNPISKAVTIVVEHDTWKHVENIEMMVNASTLGQVEIKVDGQADLDVISLMPKNVWGNQTDNPSKTAHKNYEINKNYRMRNDLVQSLYDLNPKFLRFPGGCISEGAFLWDNVFDWKQTMGPIEARKENFNLWGYSMTMGLGYFEYFQLSEDLNAYPVPVMACGVLCQARSDYAAPAGGSLRDYYISNFTDLIDFAISTDFENNKWAKMRKDFGHPETFDLKYLGVGNENWGDEFMANFEVFKYEIEKHMDTYYPGQELHIISTVGAQADDDAFQDGWKFLHGDHKGVDRLEFTDGKSLFEEDIEWYQYADHHMDTIADEHYYRTSEYYFNNVDRYDFYKRVYNEDGSLNEKETSKVFVGEYASTDKNTLHGALAEAALMTGFENNSDVVRMASYAPLFNKVLFDSTYRWTPDLIWFDNEEVWFTPNYYTQRMFANNIGERVLKTDFSTYEMGEKVLKQPMGKITIATLDSEVVIQSITVRSNVSNEIVFEQDFSKELDVRIEKLKGSIDFTQTDEGLILNQQAIGESGILINENFKDVKVDVKVKRTQGVNGILIGVGVTSLAPKNAIEYAVDYQGNTTGLRVFKEGVEGYRLGDFSTSVVAGNMRRSLHEPLENDSVIDVHIDYGLEKLSAYYIEDETTKGALSVENRTYNKEVFHSVTEDDTALYIKLVNKDGVDKLVDLDLSGYDLKETVALTSLGGDVALLDVQNVNGKSDEKVVPQERTLTLSNDSLRVDLTKYSVFVLKIEKQ